ncbi:MAG: cytochrome ubiquinol oxidase subunit I [Micromonosporaceae bacterium]
MDVALADLVTSVSSGYAGALSSTGVTTAAPPGLTVAGPPGLTFAEAATPADFGAARIQMALSLGWHIIVACFGVAMPAFTLFAEWRGHRTGEVAYRLLARRWARAMGVLFAVGAVSGTILSFEMGILWPGLMGTFGEVIGLPFTLEGFAFFIEAIFLGIYLYGWDKLSPRAHLLSAVPVLLAGVAGTFFVVSANAWMNQPKGFDLESGEVVGVDPWGAMFNPATGPQSVHMLVAAFMVAGFLTASVYAVGMLRGRRDRYHQLGFLIPFTVAAALSPVQVVVGDWAATFVAEYQPVKLAAMEGVYDTERGVPLHVGGVVVDGEMRYAVEIPNGLSLLAFHHPDAEIKGLNDVPATDHPPVNVVHLSFQLMVAAGFAMLGVAAWYGFAAWRRRGPPSLGPWFLRAAALCGPAAVVALEAGWTTTEVGRQPWVVYGVMRTADAVNPAPGLTVGLAVVVAVYTALTVATVYVLRRLAADQPAPVAPQEADVETFPVP